MAHKLHAAFCLFSCGFFSHALFLLSAAWFWSKSTGSLASFVVFFVHVDWLIVFVFF